MPWVILAAALCVLVWFWPRNTLIGLAVVGTAGVLAGIAFWINTSYGLEGKDRLEKSDPLVTTIKDWIDEQYAAGRQTVISDEEMDALLEKFAPGRFSIQ